MTALNNNTLLPADLRWIKNTWPNFPNNNSLVFSLMTQWARPSELESVEGVLKIEPFNKDPRMFWKH